MAEETNNSPFDAATRAMLPDFLLRLPNAVHLKIWGDPNASTGEREAARLARGLTQDFGQIEMSLQPRRENYPFYPVIGVFGVFEDELRDYGVRIIGLPAGYQMTSMIAAIQAVSFRGTTLEPKTRILLSRLAQDTNLELISSADDELGTLMAKIVFGLAVSSDRVRAYLVMADVFPEIMLRYSVHSVPHLVINGRYHVDGEFDEESILMRIAEANQKSD